MTALPRFRARGDERGVVKIRKDPVKPLGGVLSSVTLASLIPWLNKPRTIFKVHERKELKALTEAAWKRYREALQKEAKHKHRIRDALRPKKKGASRKEKAVRRYLTRYQVNPQQPRPKVLPQDFGLLDLKALCHVTNHLGQQTKARTVSFRRFADIITRAKVPFVSGKGRQPALYHSQAIATIFQNQWAKSNGQSLSSLLASFSSSRDSSRLIESMARLGKLGLWR